ncbi:NADH-dehydrogenase [Klebsormidium nitens]|uniref:NADH:ubiquinone reductase (non-electrogenic) n=1 Tax=Klebsormidium nitens TaxID=105231 RepID=A0A1Y1IGE9_KLENI|nr:NADH-dehydrogenase [Klebsormidium nitens]|eukprot:GAQ89703.1 NADH-dehydrogenase [Klebsormidium nitens]
MTLQNSSVSEGSQTFKLASTSFCSSFPGPLSEENGLPSTSSSVFKPPTRPLPASTPGLFVSQADASYLSRFSSYQFSTSLAHTQPSQVSAFHTTPVPAQEIQPEHRGAANATEKSVTGEPTGTLGPTRANQKPRLVILGTGWGGCRLAKDLDTRYWDIVVISPRNHMVFTPLLASTCVGTLEFRSVAEPIRSIKPAVGKLPDSYFFLAKATAVDEKNHEVLCEAVTDKPDERWTFRVAYDKLAVATGAEATTFGIKGVWEHAIFLREVGDAMAIRRKLLLNLVQSDMPGLPPAEKQRLLHVVVVGGGPTGVEFSGELSDFIRTDVKRKFSHVKDDIRVTLIEAREILNTFDVRLREYATAQLRRAGVELRQGTVKEVSDNHITLNDGTTVPYGVLVWSTGVGPSQLVKGLPFEKSPRGRLAVDTRLKVVGAQDVYALGDCAGYAGNTGLAELPALAQVAERQGKYLARALNDLGRQGLGRRGGAQPQTEHAEFVYHHLGSMASVGSYKALVDLRHGSKGPLSHLTLTGFKSWFIWRSAYLTRVVSWRNRLYVAVNWATTFLFGRDISRI